MNFEILLSSLLNTTFVVGIVGFIFKQHFLKSLNKEMEKYKTDLDKDVQLFKNKLEKELILLKDEVNKKSKIFDLQSNAYKDLATLTYESRNCVKDIRVLLNKKEHLDENDMHRVEELVSRLNSYTDKWTKLLFKETAFLAKDVFDKAHKLKHLIFELVNLKIHFDQHDEEIEIKRKEFDDRFVKIDNIYNEITEIVHQKLYVE